MKLLPKSDVAKAKSEDMQREIAEGLKLAKRVDTLREVAAQEESSLKEFRLKTLSEINKEIIAYSDRKNALSREVSDLEEKRSAALSPLTKEYEELDSKRKEVASSFRELESKQARLEAQEAKIKELAQVSALREQNSENAFAESQKVLKEADLLKKDAHLDRVEAAKHRSESQRESEVRLTNALQKESWVSERESVASLKEEHLRAEEIQLAKERSALNDARKTVESDFLRIEKSTRENKELMKDILSEKIKFEGQTEMENILNARESELKDLKAQLDKQTFELSTKDRQIKDKYAALEQAITHSKTTKNI